MIIIFLFQKVDAILGTLLQKYMEHNYIKGLGIVVLFFAIWLMGVATTNFFGKKIVHFYESVIAKIPILNTIFGGLKDISSSLLSEKSTAFKQVVLAYNPVYDFYTLGFLTSAEVIKVKFRKKTDHVLHVLVPIPPNPTSGFVLLVPEKNIIYIDMTIEEGLKTVMSLGVIHPSNYHIGKHP
jgi:uncharacterized membrane protein